MDECTEGYVWPNANRTDFNFSIAGAESPLKANVSLSRAMASSLSGPFFNGCVR